MNNPKDREELIEYLDTHCVNSYDELKSWQVADFIIEDRQRILAPLVKYKNGKIWGNEAIDQTLKLAGLEK